MASGRQWPGAGLQSEVSTKLKATNRIRKPSHACRLASLPSLAQWHTYLPSG